MIDLPKNPFLNIEAFGRMLDPKYLTNSYKLYWLIAIFEEIKNQNKHIGFKRLVIRMVAESWYSLINYKLNLGVQDSLYDLVLFLHNKYGIESTVRKDKLISFLEVINDDVFKEKISSFYQFVPYRMLTPFFSHKLVGVNDYKKNKKIIEYSNQDPFCFYKIDNNEKSIIINECWYNYILQNRIIVNGWLKYKLTNFLQRRNPSVPAIPFKLTPPYTRNLIKFKEFWFNMINLVGIRDIYTQQPFTDKSFNTYGRLSVDHFIPWSFVLHDELWNLAPTFQIINSSKSDKLPNLNKYLDSFCEMQYITFSTAIKINVGTEMLLDYLTIDKEFYPKSSLNISKELFINRLKSTIVPLYQIAYNQGFAEWHKSF